MGFSGERKADGIGGAGAGGSAGAGAGERSSVGGCTGDGVGESLAFLAGRGEGEGEGEDMCDLLSSETKKERLYRPIFFIFEFWRANLNFE